MIADGHLFNQLFLFVNDKWFQALPPEQQRAIQRAGETAQSSARGVVRIWEAVGAEELRAKGVDLYFPTEQERQRFRDLGQPPVVSMLRQRLDKKWVDGILKAVAEASK
jgi:C4-dicarboxylate-binding protein DctP